MKGQRQASRPNNVLQQMPIYSRMMLLLTRRYIGTAVDLADGWKSSPDHCESFIREPQEFKDLGLG
ncbi:hypothetical protein J2TS4_16740 [Paenibacillus sp. J2TS4]|nr:hypothetical protein J2TS4_16740 [Paenibacillus sp. J2TS4]